MSPTDGRIEQITNELLGHAFLYDDPSSYREGVLQAATAISGIDEPSDSRPPSSVEHPVPFLPGTSPGPNFRETCPECQILLDRDDADEGICPWCGARNPEPLQTLMWAELEAMEEAWPEALEA